MEMCVLALFATVLLGCVALDLPVLYAMLAGYLIFGCYALKKGFSLKKLLEMSLQGIRTTKNILITFLLIGMLTALWRAGGTIAAIVCYCARMIHPRVMILLAFLLNCLVSFLTGTAFGTAATMGCLCMTMAAAMGLDPVAAGGAVLSGVFFGDRCSPVSTSALLVADLTGTDLYRNLKIMLRTAALPFFLTCLIYGLWGLWVPVSSGEGMDIQTMFSGEFAMPAAVLIPAALILLLAVFRVNVKTTILASVLAAVGMCLLCQGCGVWEILRFCLMGYEAKDPALGAMINGGGVVSMLNVTAIVCISSCYAGIFRETGLLDSVKALIARLGKRVSAYTVVLLVSFVTGAVACNQTLSIMLTRQLCDGLEEDREKMAAYLENSAVIIAPLIPWSIACRVPTASAGAPHVAVTAAFFCMLVPLWSLVLWRRQNRRT